MALTLSRPALVPTRRAIDVMRKRYVSETLARRSHLFVKLPAAKADTEASLLQD